MTEAHRVFQATSEAWRRACRGAALLRRRYHVGRDVVEVCSPAPELLARLTAPLEHLRCPQCERVDLTIRLWGDEPLELPWQGDEQTRRGELPAWSSPEILTTYDTTDRVLACLHTGQRVAHYWVSRSAHLGHNELGAPFRAVLHGWLRRRSQQMIHAAAVGRDGRGVLLVGGRCAGKSTTAYSCLGEFGFCGDDYVLLDCRAPALWSLYSSCKLRPGGRDQVVHLIPPELTTRKLVLRAVLVCRPAEPAGLTPLPLSRAVTTTGTTTMFLLPWADGSDLRRLADCLKGLPCYSLGLGTRPGQARHLLGELLSPCSA